MITATILRIFAIAIPLLLVVFFITLALPEDEDTIMDDEESIKALCERQDKDVELDNE